MGWWRVEGGGGGMDNVQNVGLLERRIAVVFPRGAGRKGESNEGVFGRPSWVLASKRAGSVSPARVPPL